MEVECFKIELKPNSLHTIREWSKRLNDELPEVKKLLQNEGIILESVFLDESSACLIYYLRSSNLTAAREVSRASQHPLDIYHQKIMKEIAIKGTKLECLLDAETI